MEKSGRNSMCCIIETLLFYLRHRYLSATECLLFLYLYGMTDEAGCGRVSSPSLSKRFGRSRSRCRGYLKRLERHGLIKTVPDHSRGGDFFRLEAAVLDAASETAYSRDPASTSELGSEQVSTAGQAPAPRQPEVGARVLRRLQ